ncbi:hypothetical protein B7494_g3920 [Chlorociboria aeruginascens]|nr:hypothetical protein B7494_g3920 [Chlorociboria aeruginascens]
MSDKINIDPEGPNITASSAQSSMPDVSAESKTSSSINGDGPVPPPHKSNPTSPVAVAVAAPEEAEAFKTAGNKYYKAQDYRKAIEEYTKAVEAQPSSATYLNNRAAAYMAAGQYAAALEDCARADELDPQNPKVLLRLARIYTSLGRPHDAINTFDRIQPPPSAKDIAPAKAMLQHIDVAEDALKNGTTGSMVLHALDQAEKLLGFTASKPRKWQLMRGEAYLKMGNVNALGDAQNIAMSLLRYNNQDPEALVLRGRALYAQGDNEKAIQHFRQALSCDPDYRDAVKYLRLVQKLDRMKSDGNADYKAGRWQHAVDKYTEALEVDPSNKGTNSKLLQNRALCRNKLKDYSGAISDCERALTLDPSYTKARKTKASALGLSGNWEEAVRELKSIQEQDPQDASIAKEIRKAELELKKSKRKDYYKILEIEKDADDNQIKKAYRKAAIVHHPDKNPDDEHAAERFKDIGEAYETLSDPEKRARYDSGEDLMDPTEGFGGGMGGGGMNIDPEINKMSGGWNTIESDAGVFTFLLDNLGVKDVQFEELIALDASFLHQLSPVYGVIFLFKYPSDEKANADGSPKDGIFDYPSAQNLFFAAQTIQNACGTQALLSVLLNKDGEIDVGPQLREFKEFTSSFPAEFRGEALSNSELIRDVHNSFARSSPFADETQKGDGPGEDVFHFIAYTPINGVLYELDGLQPAPISHGTCTSADFPEKVIPVLQRRIGRYEESEIRFNLMAMVRDLRVGAREIGDREMLMREERKRSEWMFENALRRHNFVGFAGEVLKGVMQQKLGKGEEVYTKWIEDSKRKTKARHEDQKRKSGEDQEMSGPLSQGISVAESQLQDLLTLQQKSAGATPTQNVYKTTDSTVNGVVIGLLSSFGSAMLIALVFLIIYFFKYTSSGRILLDRMARPGEYDDEQAFVKEEAEALEIMDDLQRAEYLRAKAFIQSNPPDSLPTDISLSQYLAIQEKGVSAWEFEPELEIANCFVEARTEIEFFDSECSVMSNLPVPKQNEVYYWESKIYDKPESTLISIGMATKPYPLFRLPGWHKYSVAYTSTGHRRYNQPFNGPTYGPQYVQGDVIGVGYRPRTGTIFFTRNGKKLEDVAHGLKSQNLFPAVGANGPCTVHVNFGQSGFVFIEANVKKWGLAPMTGSLAPPPPYGSEQGSILLEAGRESAQGSQGQNHYPDVRHGRTRSGNFRYGLPPTSPGPVRSPTDISLAHLTHIPSHEEVPDQPGNVVHASISGIAITHPNTNQNPNQLPQAHITDSHHSAQPPPEYTSPQQSSSENEDEAEASNERRPVLRRKPTVPPIPSYNDVVVEDRARERSNSLRRDVDS